MRSLKFEQVAVIKFLALEGRGRTEIFMRLKRVFSKFTLPKKKIHKLYFRFLKEGLLGLSEEHTYEDEVEGMCRTPDPPSDSLYNEDDENLSEFCQIAEKVKPNSLNKYPNGNMCSKDRIDEEIFSVEEAEPLESNLVTEVSEPEVNIIELSNSDLLEEKFENGSEIEDKMEIYNSFDNEAPEDTDKLLPIMPAYSISDSVKYLENLHSDLNCLLCEERQFPFRSHLKVHLSFHVKHSAFLWNSRSLLCKKNCLHNNRGHYHCSQCSMISPHVKRVEHHFRRIHSNGREIMRVETSTAAFQKCTCVDPMEGIFLVLKSKYGFAEPVHVQKSDFNKRGAIHSLCSQEICQKAMETARQNGNYSLECKHLKEVKAQFRFPPPYFTLTEQRLKEIFLNEEEIFKCMTLNNMALARAVALVVEWVANDECVYFSVFCNDSFAEMGRTLVILHTKDNLYICSCLNRKKDHFCLYKSVSEVYFQSGFMET